MCASYKFVHKTCACFTVCLMLFMHNSVWALDALDGRLQLHGFIAQGMVNTSGNNFLGKSKDDISYDFREIGVNASYRAMPQLLFSAQLMSHRAGESDDGEPDLDYAFVDWTAFSGNWGRIGTRVGRIKNAYGLYNTTRDVPFARPGILLPQSIYFERTRKLSLASDGINFYADHLSELGTFSAEVSLGYPVIDNASETAILGKVRGDFHTDLTQLYQLKYESPSAEYVFAATVVNMGVSYDPSTVDVLKAGSFLFDPVVLSAQYNAEKWSLTGEYAFRSSRLRGFGAFPDVAQDGESYYLQGTYRVTPKLEMLMRYDVAYSNRDDRNGSEYASRTGRPDFTQYSKDWTLGLRYDVTSEFMVRAEYHNIEGTSILPTLDNPAGPASYEKRWDMWMLLGSYRF